MTATETAEHVHRWLVETPNGETCDAKCAKCGEMRTYNAGFNEKGWRGCKRCGHDYASPHHKNKCLSG